MITKDTFGNYYICRLTYGFIWKKGKITRKKQNRLHSQGNRNRHTCNFNMIQQHIPVEHYF